ncbi:UNVERIFIED_CONTAM: hypothetical protein FKN15_011810 [Acipenser sinensis]
MSYSCGKEKETSASQFIYASKIIIPGSDTSFCFSCKTQQLERLLSACVRSNQRKKKSHGKCAKTPT